MMSTRLLLLIPVLLAGTWTDAPGADALRAVASRGASAVAVGDGGRILYAVQAPHNQAWIAADTYLFDTYYAVTTSANDYVTVGANGRAMRSFDAEGYGSRWIPEATRVSIDLYGVSHAGNSLAAVGDSGLVIWKQSQSQGQWLRVEPQNVPTSRALRSVASNNALTNTITTAVGDSGTILWSVGLTLWNVATTVPTDADLRGVASGPGTPPGRFWAVGTGGTVLRSIPSATEWELLDPPVSVDLNAVVFSPPLHQGTVGVAVGDAGTILWSNGGHLWNEVDSPTTENLYGVAYTGSGLGGGFVAVGEGNTILWSADGISWNDVLVPIRKTTWGSIRGSWVPADRDR